MGTDDEELGIVQLDENDMKEVDGIFNRWKQGNREFEGKLESFMKNKVENIRKINEACDTMIVKNGKVERIQPRTYESEEIRLLKEQNELLKELLIKQQNNGQ